MNKKGFTLVELLAVIIVIGVIGSSATLGYIAIKNNKNKIECNNFIYDLETTACAYASFENKLIDCPKENCEIPISILIEEELIDYELDACTGKKIDPNAVVKVYWDNGEKKCEYKG